jgi:hypothetical protein
MLLDQLKFHKVLALNTYLSDLSYTNWLLSLIPLMPNCIWAHLICGVKLELLGSHNFASS